MDDVKYFPLDFTAIYKGQVITPDEIRTIMGLTPQDGDSVFKLKAMALRALIESECDKLGRPVVVKHEGDALRVLTDAEAVSYVQKRIDHGYRTAARYTRRQPTIDHQNLSDELKAIHERNILNSGRKLLALRTAQKQITREERRREISQG